jgi:Peptidase M10 serralysin C terminal
MASQTLANGDLTFIYPAGSSYIDLFAGQGNQNITLIGSSTVWLNNGSSKSVYTLTNAGGPNNRVGFGGSGPVLVDLQAGYAIDAWGSKDVLVNFQDISLPGNNGDKAYGTSGDDIFWLSFSRPGSGYVDGRAGNNSVSLWQLQPTDIGITVSVDARTITLSRAGYTDTLKNISAIQFNFPDGTQNFSQTFKSYINFNSVGSQTLIAPGTKFWNGGSNDRLGPIGFSFMSSVPSYGGQEGGSGFSKPSTDYQNAVRSILNQISKVVGLDFVEVSDSDKSFGQLRFGTNQQTLTKGYSFNYQEVTNDKGGDVWLDVETCALLKVGQEGYQVLIHEICHALALSHPQAESDTSGAVVLLNQWNNTAFTVMSEIPSANHLWQSGPGPLDLQALQALYGARVSPQSSTNDVYALTDQSGQMISSISDAGGVNVLDCSAVTLGVSIDLNPNSFSSVGKTLDDLAAFNNMYLDATTLIQNVYGTKFDDVLVGNNLDNIFYPLDGNDIIDGKSGLNKVIISRAASTFTWATNSSNQHVLLEDKNQKFGSKDLLNIQRVSFSDTNLAFDLNANGAAGKTAEIIGAAFGLNALSNKSYVGIGLRLFDGAMAMQDVASSAISTGLVSNPDNTSFVKAIWNNVVGTPIDEANLNSYVSQLNRGTLSQASLLVLAATSSVNASHINLVGLAQTGLEYI